MADLSSYDKPFGFMPWDSVLRNRLYSVVTATSTAMFPGDSVKIGDPLLTPHHGYLPQVLQYTSGGLGLGVGVITACFDYHMKPVGYIASSEAGNSVIAGYVMVSDHPQQIYVVQEDGDTGSIGATGVGNNIDAIATHAGNTGTFKSGMEIDSNTSATTSTLAFRIIGIHPDDTPASASTVTGHHCRYLVQMNAGFFDLNMASS